jgi:predicted transcriptional regulator
MRPVSIIGRHNKEITVELDDSIAARLQSLREDGLNVDNFTKKCHQYAFEKSIPNENLVNILEWWLDSIDRDVRRYLDDGRMMEEKDPWRLKNIGYSGHYEPFRDMIDRERKPDILGSNIHYLPVPFFKTH